MTMMNDDGNAPLRWIPAWSTVAAAVVVTYFVIVPAPGFAGEAMDEAMVNVQLALGRPIAYALALLAIGFVGSMVVAGPRAPLAALRLLLGRARPAELPLAARALWTVASCVTHLGLWISFLAVLGVVEIWRQQYALAEPPAPAHLGYAIEFALLGPLLGLGLGRFLLGAPAESAALRAGLRLRPFPAAAQLVVLFVVPLILLLVTTPSPPLNR